MAWKQEIDLGKNIRSCVIIYCLLNIPMHLFLEDCNALLMQWYSFSKKQCVADDQRTTTAMVLVKWLVALIIADTLNDPCWEK